MQAHYYRCVFSPLFVSILYIILVKVKTQILMNTSEADMECKLLGGLASYEYFDGPGAFLPLSISQVNHLGLMEGESAWITGYADYSSFVSWTGCYVSVDGNEAMKLTLADNTIHRCSKECGRSRNVDITYMGIRNNECYCIQYKDLKVLSSRPDFECNQKIDDKNYLRHGPKSNEQITRAISVYAIHDDRITWSSTAATVGQCVYAIFINDSHVHGTQSCYSLSSSICTSTFSSLEETCVQYHNSTYPSCFVLQPSSWLQSANHCRRYSGKLIDSIPIETHRYTQQSVHYWTGIFRTFIIANSISIKYSSPDLCLAIRRVGNGLVLEPDACSVAKHRLCNSNVRTVIENEDDINEGLETLDVIYIAVGVSIAIVITVVTVYVICWNKIKQEMQKKLKENKSNTKTSEIDASVKVEENIFRNNLSVSGKDIASQELHESKLLKGGNYESVLLATEGAIPLQKTSNEFEYDIVNVKLTYTGDTIDSACNVYDHSTFTCTSNDSYTYDKIPTSKPEKIAEHIDATYNTLTGPCDNCDFST